MEITHDYVDYEAAKLLKEKGFDERCSHYYIDNFQNWKYDGVLYKTGLPDDCDNKNVFQYVKRTHQFHLCNAPEYWQVIKWLRLKYNLHIHSVCTYNSKEYTWSVYIGHDRETYMPHWENKGYKFLSTPEEAELEAIKYCLNNLIDGK